MQGSTLLASQWVEALFMRLTGTRADVCEASAGPANPSLNSGSALLMIGGHTIQVYGSVASGGVSDPFVRDLLLAEQIADAATGIHAMVRGIVASPERVYGREAHAAISVRASSGRANLALSGAPEAFAALPWVSAGSSDEVELIIPLTHGAPLYQAVDTSGIWVAPVELAAFWTKGGVTGPATLTLGSCLPAAVSIDPVSIDPVSIDPVSGGPGPRLQTLPSNRTPAEPVPLSETTLRLMVRARGLTREGATGVQIPVEATAYRDGQPVANATWVQAGGRYGVRLSVDPGFESTAPRRRSS